MSDVVKEKSYETLLRTPFYRYFLIVMASEGDQCEAEQRRPLSLPDVDEICTRNKSDSN